MDAARKRKKKRRSRPVISWLGYFAVRLLFCVVQSISIERCLRVARCLAFICYDALKIRRETIDGNLAAAFPDLTPSARQQMARDMWEHIIMMACELAHVPRKIHDTNWRHHVHMSRQDMRVFVRQLLSPRPVVVVSGHYGNFEVGGIIAGLLGFPTFTVARPLDNPYVHNFVTRFRERTGQFMLPKRGSAHLIDGILQAGETLVLLGDQSAGPKGCWVDFFGRPASCHKAVALFSLVNRAPMLLAYSKRGRKPLHFDLGITAEFDPLSDDSGGVKELTQWYSDQLESTIRTDPSQYWWLHRRWKQKPMKRRRRDHATKQPAPHSPPHSAIERATDSATATHHTPPPLNDSP